MTKCVQKQNIILFSEVCPQQPINVTSVKQQIASPNFPNFYAAYVYLISVSDASSVTTYLLLSYFLSLRGHYTNSFFEKWFFSNLQCRFILTAPTGVELTFEYIDIEKHTDCTPNSCCDELIIYEG